MVSEIWANILPSSDLLSKQDKRPHIMSPVSVRIVSNYQINFPFLSLHNISFYSILLYCLISPSLPLSSLLSSYCLLRLHLPLPLLFVLLFFSHSPPPLSNLENKWCVFIILFAIKYFSLLYFLSAPRFKNEKERLHKNIFTERNFPPSSLPLFFFFSYSLRRTCVAKHRNSCFSSFNIYSTCLWVMMSAVFMSTFSSAFFQILAISIFLKILLSSVCIWLMDFQIFHTQTSHYFLYRLQLVG